MSIIMIQKIHHLGIVVKDLDEAVKMYSEKLGLKLVSTEVSDAFNVKIAFLSCGETLIELLQPIGPGMNQDFLDKTGGGFHHICYKVDDIEKCFKEMSEKFILKDKELKPGAGGSKIFFLEASSIGNVETEFAGFPD